MFFYFRNQSKRVLYCFGVNEYYNLGLDHKNACLKVIPHPYFQTNSRVKVKKVGLQLRNTFFLLENGAGLLFAGCVKFIGWGNQNAPCARSPQALIVELKGEKLADIYCGSHNTIYATENGRIFGHKEFPSATTSRFQSENKLIIENAHLHEFDFKGEKIGDVSTGGEMTVFLSTTGNAYFLDGDVNNPQPRMLSLNENFITQISCGDEHACFLTRGGENYYGNIGVPGTDWADEPILNPLMRNVKSVHCGEDFTLFLSTEDDKLHAMGGYSRQTHPDLTRPHVVETFPSDRKIYDIICVCSIGFIIGEGFFGYYMNNHINGIIVEEQGKENGSTISGRRGKGKVGLRIFGMHMEHEKESVEQGKVEESDALYCVMDNLCSFFCKEGFVEDVMRDDKDKRERFSFLLKRSNMNSVHCFIYCVK